ncbi:ABC-three component (ABC-3C) system Middle Component 3 [Flavobacterium branchiophilum]|uniref:Uncharacterized protein n=1 Tax=Flavobacterium branchiophilum (strain FL-15) TaxID=1034807 RepID=G2Z2X7_FLABF|nr:three component ABC system middle component [Flavobacterium branchiophilum]CCB70306.1 Protein of unknown function [Flavobacterium branchiophilum FL-15]
MKDNKFLYNNEGIAIIAILGVLSKMEKLDYPKVFLILPLLLNDNIVSFVKNKKSTVIGIQDLVSRRVESFTNFNKSYESFFTLTFNSICIAEELKLIRFEKNEIVYIDNAFDIESINFGDRASNIIMASTKIINVLKIDAIQLYSTLKIRI